jgi:acetyltransferase-like isoleucine patch superfamily enzyme
MALYLEHDWFPGALPENVSIGQRSWLYSRFAFSHYESRLPTGVKIGDDSGIYNGTFFDLGPEASVEIGNYCSLVGAIIATSGRVVIGDYSFIAHDVVIADSSVEIPAGRTALAEGTIIIGENVWIGMGAIILGGAKIGEGVIIGAAAVVDFEVPPFSVVTGNPAVIRGRDNL